MVGAWRMALLLSACQLAHEPTSATIPVVEVDHLGPIEIPGVDPAEDVQWTIADPRVAAVDGGTLVAIAAGNTVVTARRAAGADRYELHVVPRTVLRFHEPPARLTPGGRHTLEVLADTSEGSPRRLIGASFQSSDPMILTVSTTGELTALQPGVAYITANGEGAEAVVEIEVVPPPSP